MSRAKLDCLTRRRSMLILQGNGKRSGWRSEERLTRRRSMLDDWETYLDLVLLHLHFQLFFLSQHSTCRCRCSSCLNSGLCRQACSFVSVCPSGRKMTVRKGRWQRGEEEWSELPKNGPRR